MTPLPNRPLTHWPVVPPQDPPWLWLLPWALALCGLGLTVVTLAS